jgi:hypothetical protein
MQGDLTPVVADEEEVVGPLVGLVGYRDPPKDVFQYLWREFEYAQ